MDPYETLGITPAFSGDLRAVRNQLVKRYFEAGEAPDEERMKAINLAYALLSGSGPAGALEIATSSLASARLGELYAEDLASSGGVPPYAWSGDLPAGLTLRDGTLTGCPERTGSFPLTLTVHDRDGHSAERVFVLHVEPKPLQVLTRALPEATIRVPYEAELELEGGVGPYRWSGQPPAGLQLGDSVLFGTPLGPVGTQTLQLRVRDSARQSAEATLTLFVAHPDAEAISARIAALERRRALDPAGIAAVILVIAALTVLVTPFALVLALVLIPTLRGPARRAEIERLRSTLGER